MQASKTFKDPVDGTTFDSSSYEVRTNGSGRILRTRAPSGAMAVVMDSTSDDDTNSSYDAFADDITEEELNNMVEDYQESMNIETNPPGRISRAIGTLTQGIGGVGPNSWQSLRLPSVGFGKRAGVASKLAGVLAGLGIDRGTFRSGHASTLITARMWTNYLNNMDMQDVAAELSADISPEEKFSIYEFCKEWERDPGHVAFVQRLHNTPDVNSIDEIAKGQIVYDLMTGGVRPGPGGVKDPSTVKHDKMFRLALDIINSIRLIDYNFYTLNVVHRDEGTRLYDDFMANYVPLEPDEVEVIHEVRQGIERHGQSYAFKSTDSEGDPMGAYDLMIRLNNAYNSGDTRLCRSILDTLFAYPYRFVPNVGYKGLFSPTSSRFIGQEPLHLFINKGWRWILPTEAVSKISDDGRKFTTEDNAQLIEVLDFNYPKPIGVFTKLSGGANKFSYMPWTQFERTGQAAASMVPQSSSDFDNRVRDAMNEETAKSDRGDKSRSGGKGGGGRGGGGKGRYGKRNPPKKNPGHAEGMEEWAAGMLRNTKYARLVDLEQMRFRMSQLKEHGPYLMFGANGFWPTSDEALRQGFQGEDGIVDVASYIREYGNQGEYAVYNLNTDEWFPFGSPKIQSPKRNPAPGRKGKKDGTLSLGRGKQYHIEILPKTQLKGMSKGAIGIDKATGKERRKGRDTLKSQGKTTKGERLAGITDAFGSYQHVAVDKVTGKTVPFVIKVPSKHFRAVNLEVEGKTIRTLMPMTKTSKKQQEAWAKFLSVYGYPKLANTKGDPVRFKIHKPTRGSFYRRLMNDRKKAKKA